MKKNILIFLAVLATLGLRAQDTMQFSPLPSKYFYNQWMGDEESKVMDYYTWGYPWAFNAPYIGKYYFTPDTLTIYGIAVALGYDPDLSVYNNWTDNMYEFVSIYKHEGDTLRKVSDSLRVHMYDTPVALYIKNAPNSEPLLGICPDPYPVFEVFYDTPVVVTDSFYLCMTVRSTKKYYDGVDENGDSIWVGFTNYPVHGIAPQYGSGNKAVVGRQVYCLRQPSMTNPHELATFYYFKDETSTPIPNFCDPFIFPILSPYTPDTTTIDTTHADTTQIDTTHVDTTHVDTLGISMQMMERHIGVHPNPATERVLVTSSFGLQRIELYNAAGTKVKELKAAGYSTTLDVSAFPVGPYLVRITTPYGTVTKKLIVQRQ